MITKALQDESELLAKIVEGDALAFKTVYGKFNKKSYTIALQILRSSVLAEEITQEVFLQFWRHKQRFNNFDHMEAWLRVTAKNLSLNAFRKLVSEKKHNQQAGQQFVEDHNETEETILLREARKVLTEAIGKLPAQQREIYILCQQNGLKYEEVAEQLNISVNTVKTHMKRALASVRFFMKNRVDLIILIILLKLF
ncbi:RNA polymerase sigma-70 factor [Pedobacter nyackensis]|uniref:RNA polymerase sigma factor n=1 Tax=Pedobacter nyackensis TaxID=475255 RepID=UPI00292E956A|nr:RNA polymerase sigma-70 factor [Pedobacter nyackensis]